MLTAFGNTAEQISQLLRISPPTLREHYRAELDVGLMKANNAVAANLFKQATKDDPRSFYPARFWLLTRAGWSEYSPVPPKPTVPEKLGKKEQAAADAESAEQNTGWSDLIH